MKPKPAVTRESLRRALAETIKTLRKERGINQEDLAYESGIDRAYLGAIERCRHSPSFDTIYKVLPVLGINLVTFAKEFERQLKRVSNPRAAA
jgi:transcriptional regulator with XRE-family HTH domain